MLYRWRKEFQNNGPLSFPGNDVQALSEDARHISELEKHLFDAETERNILKKALGIISKSGH